MIDELPRLAIVVPCYNEEEVFEDSLTKLLSRLDTMVQNKEIANDSFVLLVDDGSRDKTWEHIASYQTDFRVIGLKLAHNVGHQNALLAGLLTVKNEVNCTISVDADLQDDIMVMSQMVQLYREGYEIVYGVRSDRQTDTLFKKYTAYAYYKILKWLGVDSIENHADFRLLGQKALTSLSEFQETHLFLRGIIPLLGYKTTQVYYERLPRLAGESKYSLSKMLALAWNGITSFSVAPLRIISALGFLIFSASLFMLIWIFISNMIGRTIPGWASTVLPIYFIGGIQLLAIGVIGEYLGKIYLEVKKRPRFIKETYLE